MQPKSLFTNAVAAVALLAAACGSTSPTAVTSPSGTTAYPPPAATSPSPSPAATSPSPSPAAKGTTIAVAANGRLGQILVDGKGISVYLFVADKGTSSTCYTSCAQYWPPVLTTGAPRAGSGAQSMLLGTTTRTDGKIEVTYKGHPLYYFLNDKKAGDTTGQGVNAFGGLWWVLSPAGAAIKL
jgi:predicted lipoprotein with Yx(FWY)xxD motif